MSRKNHQCSWLWITAVVFIVLAGLTVSTSGQQPGRMADPRDSLRVPILTFGPQEPAELEGLPDDWSHHHLVFSNPGTEEDAIQKGTYDNWLRIVNDPRYIMQQLKLRSPAQGPAAEYVARINELARAEEATAGEDLGAPQSTGPIGPVLVDPGRLRKAKIRRDWSMSLGSGGKVGAGQFPAKFSFSASSASCSDYVAYPTGLAGSSTQATVVAYNNVYATTCGSASTRPGIYWAYNTGGTATLSPAISVNGSQIAYIQVSGTTASLVLLKMASSGGTVGAPASITSVANSSYYNCTAPCYTTITLNGSPNDTNSSPFYDYTDDIIYVGDNSGKLHKFTPVFNGTPAEVMTGWPITVSSNILTSPVYDAGTSNCVFVADSGGYLYSYAASSATHEMTSSQLAATGSKGIVDGPLVDSTTEMVYVFVGDDENTNTTGAGPRDCDSATGCNGVFQFAAGDTTIGTGVCTSASATSWGTATNCGEESVFGIGSTSTVLYDGSFDQIYYSGTGTTGNLWTCAATATSAPKLTYTTMSAFVPSGDVVGVATNAVRPLTGTGAGTAATCSPVTEIYGAAGTTDDYIFLSVTNDGNQTGTACSGTGAAGACLYNFVVSTNGTSTSVPTAATAGLAVAGGSSGIIIDNISTATGASQIYFSSLSNQTCAGNGTTGSGTGGCAVQASQAAP